MNHRFIHTGSSVLTLVVVLVLCIGGTMATPALAAPLPQLSDTGGELLGNPTDHSITINVIPNTSIQLYYRYGTDSGVYTGQTGTESAASGQPHETVIDGLDANTKYYYRMVYSTDGSMWIQRDEHSFQTQRAPGSTFTFTIIADSHAMYNTQYQNAMTNVLSDAPDFHLDLGDTFMTDNDTSQSQVDAEYLAQRNPLYMGRISHSVPIFVMPGNHENEEGWNLDDTFSIALASIQARKMYYPTPITDDFYTGNEDPLAAINESVYGDELREDYYAWEWGDALFVVFDPFQYTMQNPYGASAGEGSDDPATGDRWNWSLGQQQFNWFKTVLEESDARYKFIFAHHMVGGTQNYVRGGAVPAHMFEWGGYDADGTTWLYDTKRPGWEETIRQVMIDNGVSAFFHGHDHQYAYEVRDGIVYQSMPRPSSGMDFTYYSESNQYTERVLGSPGHLRVTVTPSIATVEYVSSTDTTGTNIKHTYTIEPNEPPEPVLGDVTGNGTVDSTEALIILSCDADIDTADFCPMYCGDVNNDGFVNSTDAGIILSYDAGMTVSYEVGSGECPTSLTQLCPGCTP